MLGNNLVGISTKGGASNVGQFKVFVRKKFSEFLDLWGHNSLKSDRQLFVD